MIRSPEYKIGDAKRQIVIFCHLLSAVTIVPLRIHGSKLKFSRKEARERADTRVIFARLLLSPLSWSFKDFSQALLGKAEERSKSLACEELKSRQSDG